MKHPMTDFKAQLFQKLTKKTISTSQKDPLRSAQVAANSFPLILQQNPRLGSSLGVQDILPAEPSAPTPHFNLEKGMIICPLQKSFEHYRIAMAVASAANTMGYIPYWLDFDSFLPDPSKAAQNVKLKKKPVHKEPKNKELFSAVFHSLPKELPLITIDNPSLYTSGEDKFKHTLNIIPGSKPILLPSLSNHKYTIQTYLSFLGCCSLNDISKNNIYYTGHYIDHELTSNISTDCLHRIKRAKEHQPMRFLISLDKNSCQTELYMAVIHYLLPLIRSNRATLYINMGDCISLWHELLAKVPELETLMTVHSDDWSETTAFASNHIRPVSGVHSFCHSHIEESVYATNLLLRSIDVLITTPSELAFYPVPKLLLKHAHEQEQWNAVHSAELGDGTLECPDIPHTIHMLELFLQEDSLLQSMCQNISRSKSIGLYDGAYKVVELAFKR